MPLRLAVSALALAVLAACSSAPKKTARPEPPTLASLLGREVPVKPDTVASAEPRLRIDEEAAAKAYQEFLASSPRDPHRQEALRRLGDLEMDRVDNLIGTGERQGTPEDYRAAITRYREFLAAYPTAAGNDRVLYQMARAQELSGDLEGALKTLTRLVDAYPGTRFLEEAQFRRGELLFTLRDYGGAEAAYQKTLMAGPGWPYYERSMYMHGWAQFKQGRLEEALTSFFGVLDLKLAGTGNQDLEKVRGFTRADRELVDDTFRVTSISLANLNGAASIPPFVTNATRREYEFRIYQQLALRRSSRRTPRRR
ncbi:MAG: tetratricopeptide repeat protein [Burkholderiaceae bacterium]|nr:tetratricopeptide repeat protein [Burkholderiaceae bacterium]